jgi:hypothetical protein
MVSHNPHAPIGWWFAWRKAQHGKDEAVRYFNTFVETYPVPPRPAIDTSSLTDRITELTLDASTRGRRVVEWLKFEWELTDPNRALRNPVALDADTFLKTVRETLPKKRKLTAAEIAELTREHAATIEPARQAHAAIFGLERMLSDIVNEAYGLTPEEIHLMWRSAPPRMPFTPAGLATEINEAATGSHDDEDAVA